MIERSKHQVLNTFYLKLIAVFTMTLDHIAMMMIYFMLNGEINLDLPLGKLTFAFKIIGRISLPLFAICFAEAMRYSKDRKLYIQKMFLMSMIIMIPEILLKYIPQLKMNSNQFDNIFLLFLASSTFIYFIEMKNNKKLLCIIPAIYIVIVTIFDILMVNNSRLVVPGFIHPQYTLLGFLLFVGFYFIYKLSDERVESLAKNTGKSLEDLRKSAYYRSFTNILWSAYLFLLTIFCWLLVIINPKYFDLYQIQLQSWAPLAIIFILLYNGYEGIKNNKIKLGFYLYYPLHLLIIFIPFFVLFH